MLYCPVKYVGGGGGRGELYVRRKERNFVLTFQGKAHARVPLVFTFR